MADRDAGLCLSDRICQRARPDVEDALQLVRRQQARRSSGLPVWVVEIRNPDGSIAREEFDFVAVCTGQFNEPERISHPGAEAFKAAGGKILHSAEHTDASIVRGRKVVVLGGSKSATDIAVNSVHAGAGEVTLVYREPVWRIPYFIGGVGHFKPL